MPRSPESRWRLSLREVCLKVIAHRSRHLATFGAVVVVCAVVAAGVTGPAYSDPGHYEPVSEYDQPELLPIITPTRTDWQPKFPFPFDQTQRFVTVADINAEREMCQWYNAQYKTIRRQVQGLNANVVRHNGDFDAPVVAQQIDIVLSNLTRAVDFLTPRAQALTQSYDRGGNMYFPLYQGDAFYGLWQQMSNLANGLRARQPTWFTGPSFHLMQFWGSKIHRSRVCG